MSFVRSTSSRIRARPNYDAAGVWGAPEIVARFLRASARVVIDRFALIPVSEQTGNWIMFLRPLPRR